MRRIILLIICCSIFSTLSAQETERKISFLEYRYNDSILVLPKKPVKAAIETIGLNTAVWAFDRYAIKGDYAYIGWNTMERNLKTGFVWDNDQFSTNLFFHPYHGGLYLNTARSNGLNFWQSTPYAVGGSLMWEFLMENEPPAINDFLATSIGGVCLGEVTFRLSDLLIDDRATGWNRFGREFLTTVVSPMRGLNRIMSGDAWKTRRIKGRSVKSIPARFYVVSGHRVLAEDSEIMRELDNGMYVDLKLAYGNPFSEENEKPYDSFSLRTSLNFFSGQPLIGNVSAIGQLWGKTIPLKNKKSNLSIGVFQHFDYYDSEVVFEGKKINSYKISEAAAFGFGGAYYTSLFPNTVFIASAHLNAILLGGSITDYYRAVERDYNLGSGHSSKVNATFIWGTKFDFSANLEDYRLYTWKGYNPDQDLDNLTHNEQLYLNAQGDKGNAHLTVINLNLNFRFRKHYTITTETSYYFRGSQYDHHPDVRYQVVENKIGFGYLF